jgi:hypothetical protein
MLLAIIFTLRACHHAQKGISGPHRWFHRLAAVAFAAHAVGCAIGS